MIEGFLFEELGVHTGFPFGYYEYNFPPYILGIPVAVILAWGIFSFLSSLALIPLKGQMKKIFLFPILMVTIDLAVDPIMVTAGAWKWLTVTSPNWFGIPYTNFLGWFLVSLIIAVSYFPWNKVIRWKERNTAFYLLLPLDYFLLIFNFFLHAKPQLTEPLLISTIISALLIGGIYSWSFKGG
ncbi:membrane protein [Candidatus Acidianus copahuensis]|uniref:Membrane protein n=2 Tax=Sulfolobaceae TaxID=118883 RepID=A0A031LRX4_9CREN|nr:membrane protein [Candidatus Acidianus copahuensis]